MRVIVLVHGLLSELLCLQDLGSGARNKTCCANAGLENSPGFANACLEDSQDALVSPACSSRDDIADESTSSTQLS